MSGGNCPETPRQKMIGMMYLMLTAMLALNVSGDLLNAFDLVDKSIKSSTRNVEAKNVSVYSQFSNANAQNPQKSGEAYKQALEVQALADTMFNHIRDIKNYIVHRSDGPEFDEDNYLSKSNQDIAATILIVENMGARGNELRERLSQFREELKKYIKEGPAGDLLKKGLETGIVIKDTVDADGVKVSWQSQNFEHIPLAASMALLSNMQGAVRNAEADVIAYLYQSIDAASFKFNKIEPLIIAKSNYVIQGSSYEADIMLAAYDDTAEPTVTVGGQELKVENGRGKYIVPGSGVGNKSYEAKLSIQDPMTGEPIVYNVKGEYEVAQAQVTVSPIKMNAMYRGLENPIEISAPGVSGSDLKVSATGCQLKKQGNYYVAIPGPDKVAKISVSAQINGKNVSFPAKEFRIYKVPDPTPELPGAKNGRISVSALKGIPGPVATLKDFVFDTKFEIVGFSLSTRSGGFDVSEDATGPTFTQKQRALMSKLSRGQKFFIESIKAKGPDGTIRNLGTISLKAD